MSSIPRKSYDTDIITLRRIFAYNQDTNAPIPPGTVLAVTGSRGAASFIDPIQISSLANLSSFVGFGKFPSLSTANLITSTIQFIDMATQTPQLMMVSSGTLFVNGSTILGSGSITTSQLASTVVGLGSSGYISSLSTSQLSTGILKSGSINTSTVNLIDAVNGSLRTITSSNNFLYYNGSVVNYANLITNTSTYIYQVSSVSSLYAFTIPVSVSSATNLYINTDFFSSISFSTGVLTTSSVNFQDSSNGSTQSLGVSTGLLLLNGAPIIADLTKEQLFSTTSGLGTLGYISSSQLTSTTSGILASLFPPFFASTVAGLGSAGYISTSQLTSTTTGILELSVPLQLQSTVTGLGSAGYISTSQLTSTTASVTLISQLTSTVTGLGSAGYISSSQLTSSVSGLLTTVLPPLFTSTVAGLGRAGYISTSQLVSTTSGILSVNISPSILSITSLFVSSASLYSSFSNIVVPFTSGYSSSNFLLRAQSNTLNLGFSGLGTSQIFVGDAQRAYPANTEPLITITQDVTGVNPRAANVLNILGGVNNSKLIKVDSNLGLGISIDQTTYKNSTALPYTLQVGGSAYASELTVQNFLVASNYLATSTIIVTHDVSQFSSFGPVTSNIRLALASGDAYKPTGATWKTLSDARIKEEIVDADISRCYNDLKSIPLRRYRYASSFVEQAGVYDKTVLGFVAQEIAPIMPKSITTQNLYGFEDLRTISVDQIQMAAVGALKKTIHDKEVLESTAQGLMTLNQQLVSQITDLTQRLSALQDDYTARVSTIEGRMEEMKNDLSMSHSIL